ncbi:MAG: hypothetical protein KatS3mg066_4364 [Fischerella sp.]|jgi:hypothetical protein|nr:MAG: hypothetical protein KatS3mg066_4364 [Fischerella sp.]
MANSKSPLKRTKKIFLAWILAYFSRLGLKALEIYFLAGDSVSARSQKT